MAYTGPGRVPPCDGDKWIKVSSGKVIVFTGGVHFDSIGRNLYETASKYISYFEYRFTDGTLIFDSFGGGPVLNNDPETGPRFPPEEGDVWAHNERSEDVRGGYEKLGREVVFTGRVVKDTLIWAYALNGGEYAEYAESWFHNVTGGLSFVRRGGQKPAAPVRKRPHNCNRCGAEALLMATSVECLNRECVNYTA